MRSNKKPRPTKEEKDRCQHGENYHLSEPIEIKNEYFEFRSSYRQEGDKISYQGELIMKALRITPEEYASYKNCCFGMEKSFNRSVLFQKKKDRLTY